MNAITDLLNGTPGSGVTTATTGTIPATACSASNTVVICDGSAET